jgi:hypothetical protein
VAVRSLIINGLLPIVPDWMVGQGLVIFRLLVACSDQVTPTAPVTLKEMLPLDKRVMLPGGNPGAELAGGLVTVSDCVAAANKPLVPVMVGVPALLSL